MLAPQKFRFSIAIPVLPSLIVVKDSNAAPSSVPTPANNAARGKTVAPKAKSRAVSKAKARAKAKNRETEKSVAPKVAAPNAAAPRAVAPEASAPKAKVVAPAAATSNASAPAAKAATSKIAAPPVAPDSVAAKSGAPEIPFPQALAPKVAPSKTAQPQVSAAKDTAKVAPAKVTAPPTPSPKRATSPVAVPVVARERSLPKMRPLTIFGAVAALALTMAGGVAVGSYNNWSNSQLIAPKVRVAGEPIGGLTRAQAIARLNERFGKLAFTLQTDDKNIVLGLADVGGRPSIEPTVDKAFSIGRGDNLLHNFTRVFGSEVNSRAFMLPIEWNRGALTSRLQIVNQQYARPAADARLVTVSGAAPRVTGEETGRALDVSATADAIQKSYFLGLSKVAAVTHAVTPKVMAADLAGRDVKLGEYRTDYNGGIAGRTTNIHVACRALDGQVLMPGEVLSFNSLTGERTYKKGYRMAHIFLREKGQTQSQVVDGLAGGVCQVSSTLYNAVRKTNAKSAGKPLDIVERNSHSLPVTYVPSGRDATVAWPDKDFKFRNDNNFPVYVRTNVGNGSLTISIWGRVPQDQAVPVSLED